MNVKRYKVLFYSTVAGMLLMSLTFLLVPVASKRAMEGEQQWQVLTGILFWATFLLSYILLFVTNWSRKRQKEDKAKEGLKAWGIFRVASNSPARIADIVFVISLIGFLIFNFRNSAKYGTCIFFCITVFAFHMHCMLNGVNYKTITDSKTIDHKKQ